MPSRYSGAGPTFRRLAENIDNCYIAAKELCFEGDITDKCISLSIDDIKNLRNYQRLNPYLFGGDYDLVVYASPDLILNTEKPQLCWAVGQGEKIHPEIKHLLLHNAKWQQPVIQNPDTKIHEFVLGIDIPLFQEYEKENFGFQCSNHYFQINSATIAHWCRKHKIPWLFAGPISLDYKELFLNEIDYKHTFYLGQIEESEKIKLLKKARGYSNCVGHPINGPQLGVKQAWAFGCPIISTNMGIMPEVVQNGKNGFLISSDEEFVLSWEQSQKIDQKVCWETANLWSMDKMIDSFNQVIEKIIKG